MQILFRFLPALVLALVQFGVATAGGPVITKYDAHLLEREVRLNITWQSDEPIVKIVTSADKEQVVVTEGIDNERNDAGYSGVIDVVVPFNPENFNSEQIRYMNRQSETSSAQHSSEFYESSTGPYQYAVPYSIQLVDEVNQRSMLVKDKLRRFESKIPLSKGFGRTDKRNNQMTEAVVVDARNPLQSAINTAIDLVDKIGSKPKIRNFNIKNYADNRISFEIMAEDDKGVEQISYEIRTNSGLIVLEDSLSCSTEKQCSRTTIPTVFNDGPYFVSAVATDGEANKSEKEQRQFTVRAVALTVAPQTAQSQQETPDSPMEESTPIGNVPGL